MFSGLPCETHIAHIARIARTRWRVEVQRVGGHRAHIAHIAWSWGRVEPNPGTFVRFCATKCYSYRVYIHIRPGGIAFFARFCATKCYSSRVYMYVRPARIAFARFLHGLPAPAPAGLIGSPNPRSILARPTGPDFACFARFWGCAPF